MSPNANRSGAGRSRGHATIHDVAAAAGVSVATVSRALRGLDRVNEATRERVLAAAAALHYVASPSASSLASGRTGVVGVAVPFGDRWFFATVLSSIARRVRAQGYQVMLLDLEQQGQHEDRLPLTSDMLAKRLDGIITVNIAVTGAEIALIDRLGIPLVSVGTRVPGRPVVRIDDAAAARLATEHVVGLGHTKIGYVGRVPPQATGLTTPAHRFEAFTQVLSEHRIPLRSTWVLDSDWTMDDAFRDATALLRRTQRPTALVVGSDEMAFGVMNAARRLGIQVPHDLSVVGIDDHPFSDVLDLSTVRQDVVGQGLAAADLLLPMLRGRRQDPALEQVEPIRLIERGSTYPAV